ncbi:hypothetical protein [Haladaptatus paucihalophilus]|uniref:hypothetical protein n=1 Tax=Haladaptatus paucihalophilus TaxID=367189 RepID=UPI0012B5ED83|nr:hypothetical protein [Haladaptatus paucihalophilus]
MGRRENGKEERRGRGGERGEEGRREMRREAKSIVNNSVVTQIFSCLLHDSR